MLATKPLPLTLGLGLVNAGTPDIDAVPPNEHGKGIRVLLHGLLEILCEVLLVGGILDDGNAQGVMVPEVPDLAVTSTEALDLLNVVDLEDLVVARPLGLEQEGDEDGPLGVRMDAAGGAAAGEGGEEERGALRGLEGGRGAEVDTLLLLLADGFVVLGREGHNVDVLVLHHFLLDARGGDVDEVAGGM